MGNIFDFNLWDVINHPILKLTGNAIKTGVKAATSANEKAENEEIVTPELAELLNNAHAGDSQAYVDLALHYMAENDVDTAKYCLREAISHGHVAAEELLDMLQ